MNAETMRTHFLETMAPGGAANWINQHLRRRRGRKHELEQKP